MVRGVLRTERAVLDPGVTSINSPYSTHPFSTILHTKGVLDRLLMIPLSMQNVPSLFLEF